ncbi:GM10554 [Drosophila sechellia]|uniref:GM10554 n=1 Tax=Drosophila sechellia TaxID=7238 RepID=B4I4G1_DROSE|nr:GM10554 [Drosophila sechellia]
MDTTPNAAPNPNQNRDFLTLKPLRPSRGSSSNLRASRSPSASRSTEQTKTRDLNAIKLPATASSSSP